MRQRFSVTEVCSEVEQRLHHSDRVVRSIATSLLRRLQKDSKSWLHQVINHSHRHPSLHPFEVALLLEKIVLHHELSSFWEALPNTGSALPNIRKRLSFLIRTGWKQTISNITEDEALGLVGRPIQTHRLKRYEGLFNCLAPLLKIKSQKSPMVVLDAGAAAGVGAYAAQTLSLPIKKWVAVDQESPHMRLPWILTCSMRIDEMFTPDIHHIVQRFRKPLPSVEFVQADFTDMRQTIQSSSVDLYLAVYSFYQVSNIALAIREARRVTREGGLIVVTDFVQFNGSTNAPMFVSPGKEGKIQTLGWINDNIHPDPFLLYQWEDTDLTRGQPMQLYQAAKAYVEANT